jgi:glycosyltransferase involved in cell wall biosynthesis
MVSISYCITTHNEGAVYIKPLLDRLLKHIQPEDEIVLVDDFSDDPSTVNVLEEYRDRVNLYFNSLDNDFAAHKNFAKSKCTKDYIFFIDADENVHESLLITLKEILYNNPTIEMFMVPRINIVQGLTEQHVQKWNWNVNEKGFVNYPDPQTRIVINKEEIKWENKVHERLVGHSSHTLLPFETEDYCLLHIKDIKRQEAQNGFYATL